MSAIDKLSPRERSALELFAQGNTAKEIGRQLGVSHKTIQVHATSVRAKLGVRSIAHATAMWARHEALKERA